MNSLLTALVIAALAQLATNCLREQPGTFARACIWIVNSAAALGLVLLWFGSVVATLK